MKTYTENELVYVGTEMEFSPIAKSIEDVIAPNKYTAVSEEKILSFLREHDSEFKLEKFENGDCVVFVYYKNNDIIGIVITTQENEITDFYYGDKEEIEEVYQQVKEFFINK
ncbi:hypothetical protein [Segatella salivae]|uniref:hypothetical protein n=1 Tax=Segatella salivae TaxID=228604 RepID=UPI0028DB928E|nr:hypothetical protein [Segatella salivae]